MYSTGKEQPIAIAMGGGTLSNQRNVAHVMVFHWNVSTSSTEIFEI